MVTLVEGVAVDPTKCANNAGKDEPETSCRANHKVGKCATAPAAREALSQE